MTFQREVLSPPVHCALKLSLVIHGLLIDDLQTLGNKELCIPQVILWMACLGVVFNMRWLSASWAFRLGRNWLSFELCKVKLTGVPGLMFFLIPVHCKKVLYNGRLHIWNLSTKLRM